MIGGTEDRRWSASRFVPTNAPYSQQSSGKAQEKTSFRHIIPLRKKCPDGSDLKNSSILGIDKKKRGCGKGFSLPISRRRAYDFLIYDGSWNRAANRSGMSGHAVLKRDNGPMAHGGMYVSPADRRSTWEEMDDPSSPADTPRTLDPEATDLSFSCIAGVSCITSSAL